MNSFIELIKLLKGLKLTDDVAFITRRFCLNSTTVDESVFTVNVSLLIEQDLVRVAKVVISCVLYRLTPIMKRFNRQKYHVTEKLDFLEHISG